MNDWRQRVEEMITRDCQRIRDLLIARGHGEYDLAVCRRAWERNSQDMYASWLALPSDDDWLYRVVLPYVPMVCGQCGRNYFHREEGEF